MAPVFAQNNTSRLWVTYTSSGIRHEILFRGPVAGALDGLTTTASAICAVMADLMLPSDNFESARFSELGSSFSAPVPWAIISGNGSSSVSPGDSQSHYADFIGRDYTFGARVRWSLFSASASLVQPDSNRAAPGANALLDAVVAILTTAATNAIASTRICAISKGQPQVYPYINLGWNSYWQRAQRG
jgi:hypothetical protein